MFTRFVVIPFLFFVAVNAAVSRRGQPVPGVVPFRAVGGTRIWLPKRDATFEDTIAQLRNLELQYAGNGNIIPQLETLVAQAVVPNANFDSILASAQSIVSKRDTNANDVIDALRQLELDAAGNTGLLVQLEALVAQAVTPGADLDSILASAQSLVPKRDTNANDVIDALRQLELDAAGNTDLLVQLENLVAQAVAPGADLDGILAAAKSLVPATNQKRDAASDFVNAESTLLSFLSQLGTPAAKNAVAKITQLENDVKSGKVTPADAYNQVTQIIAH